MPALLAPARLSRTVNSERWARHMIASDPAPTAADRHSSIIFRTSGREAARDLGLPDGVALLLEGRMPQTSPSQSLLLRPSPPRKFSWAVGGAGIAQPKRRQLSLNAPTSARARRSANRRLDRRRLFHVATPEADSTSRVRRDNHQFTLEQSPVG